MPNLTPSEIAEIEEKAEDLYPVFHADNFIDTKPMDNAIAVLQQATIITCQTKR